MGNSRMRWAKNLKQISLVMAGIGLVACVPGQEDGKDKDCKDSTGRSVASVLGLDSDGKGCEKGDQGQTKPKPPKPYPFPENPGRVCTVDRFDQPKGGDELVKKVDILFVMDHSGSMADDWARVANNVQNLVKELPKDIDIRYAVLLANASSWKGRLYAGKGQPVVLSNQKMRVQEISQSLHKTFTEGMKQSDAIGSGEASFLSLYHAATTHSRDNQKIGFFRPDAALSILFMSDEHEIGSPFPNPQAPGLPPRCDAASEDKVKLEQYDRKGINLQLGFNALKALKGDMPVMTHAFVNITKEDLFKRNSKNAKCLYDSLGYGYFEAVALTKGVLFSIQDDKAEGMSRCGKVIRERLQVNHEFKLSKTSDKVDAATILAAVDGAKQSHSYRASNNIVHLDYAGEPGSRVEIQHCEPAHQVNWNLIGFTGQAGQYAASLSWQTPEYATRGKLLWGTSSGALTNQIETVKGVDHGVTVEGLLPNTLYFFQAVASDEFGSDGEKRSAIISLRTQPDWNVVGETAQPSRNTVVVSWKTPEYATKGKVLWGQAGSGLVNESAETPAGNEHSVTLSGLVAGTSYQVQCVSSDEYGLVKKTSVLTVRTVNDWALIGFKGLAGQTTAVLDWQTPEFDTVGRVIYGVNPNNLSSVVSSSGTNDHVASVSGLTPNTVYYFQAISRDNLGLEKFSNVISLKTQADWNLLNFAGTSTINSVSLGWQTPEYPTEGLVRWGATAESLSSQVASTAVGVSHEVTVGGLSDDTIYYFQAVSRDEYGLVKVSPVVAVRTVKKPVDPEPLPVWAVSDFGTVATKNTVAVAWKTSDYPTVGKVLWGTAENALNQEVSEVSAVRDHALELTGLSPDTLYYVQAVSVDDAGQEKRSAVTAVRTLADTTGEEPPIGDWTLVGFDASTSTNTADVIWRTPGADTKATLLIGLSPENLTTQVIQIDTFAQSHLVPVNGLDANTAYYMKVIAADRAGKTVESVVIMKRTKAQ